MKGMFARVILNKNTSLHDWTVRDKGGSLAHCPKKIHSCILEQEKNKRKRKKKTIGVVEKPLLAWERKVSTTGSRSLRRATSPQLFHDILSLCSSGNQIVMKSIRSKCFLISSSRVLLRRRIYRSTLIKKWLVKSDFFDIPFRRDGQKTEKSKWIVLLCLHSTQQRQTD